MGWAVEVLGATDSDLGGYKDFNGCPGNSRFHEQRLNEEQLISRLLSRINLVYRVGYSVQRRFARARASAAPETPSVR